MAWSSPTRSPSGGSELDPARRGGGRRPGDAEQLGGITLPAQTVAALVDRAGGNPLFLTELLEAVKESGDLDALPESMESLIAAGIDTLAPPDRRVLRQAAVLGRQFPEQLLRELVDAPRLEPTLGRLSGSSSATATSCGSGTHSCARPRTRASRSGLEPICTSGRRATSRQAGTHADEDAELLSLHFFHGRAFDKALRYSRIAGDRAQADLAPVEAAASTGGP